jgi:hypothetical protein
MHMKWPFMGMLALLPLQWYVVGNTPFGVGRLHQLGIFLFAILIFSRYRSSAVWSLRGTLGAFLLMNVYMLTAWSAIQLYQGQLPFGPVQEMLYVGVFLAIGVYILRVGTGREPGALEVLRWAAALTSVSLLLALSYSMARNGVNPARVFGQTIAAGNPEIFQKELFKTAFTGFGYDDATVRGNIRHEVFGAILCAMYISAWAANRRPFRTTLPQLLYQLSMLLATVLLISSLSRSILIAAAVWPLLSIVRSVRSFTLSARQLALTYVAIALVGVIAASGVGLVLWNRFTVDTSSYQARTGLYQQAFSLLSSSFLLGGVDTVGASSHNFVLDALLRGGIFVALPAALLVLSILWTFVRLVSRLHLTPVWMLPVAASLVLPLVRFVTSGGGLINPVEWVTLAFAAGAIASEHYRDPVPVRTSAEDKQLVPAS